MVEIEDAATIELSGRYLSSILNAGHTPKNLRGHHN